MTPSSRSCAAAALPRRTVLGLRLVVQARAVVEEVLPRALGAPGAEALELLDQVVRARAPRRSRRSRPRSRPPPWSRRFTSECSVRGDEVHRPVRQPLVGQRRPHRRPPAARQPRVAGLRAAEHPQPQVQLALAHLVDERRRARPARTRACASSPPRSRRRARRRRAARAPPAAPPRAAARAACSTRAGRRRASGSRRRGRRSRPAGPRASRCPESYQRRRRAGASTASQSSIRPIPARANASDSWPTTITRRLPDRRRQPPQRVQERAEVGRLHVVRERVQARVHRRVRGLEHAQQRLARRAQQRRVGAVVELDLVGGQPGGLAQRPARASGGDAQTWDGHEL